MAGDRALAYDQLTDLITGEVDRQLKARDDALESMKSKMTSVLKEFEDLAWNVNTKRSWMKSVTKSKELFPTNPSAMAIHPVVTSSNIVPQLSRLPKYVRFTHTTLLFLLMV